MADADGALAVPPGISAGPLARWFAESLQAVPPLQVEPLAGGYSNLTFLITDADGARWVLRRPPLGQLLATAHDMERESRIMAALAGSGVPVPAVLCHHADSELIGAPFFVMSYVPGQVVRTPLDAAALRPAQRAAAGYQLFDVLTAVHAVDVAAAGLQDLARPGSYVQRQLRRWHRQWADSRTRDLPLIDELHAELAARAPADEETTLIHGDYRLDNVILGDGLAISAVLDWELSTVGDPLADLGMSLAYWTEPGDPLPLPPAATDEPGFPTRRQAAERYLRRSGRTAGDLSFYVALAHWKVACIAEGVYARYLAGDMGSADVDLDLLRRHPQMRADAARSALDGNF